MRKATAAGENVTAPPTQKYPAECRQRFRLHFSGRHRIEDTSRVQKCFILLTTRDNVATGRSSGKYDVKRSFTTTHFQRGISLPTSRKLHSTSYG